ncbi:hypothetical protein BJ165DRAFT_1526389 [Panaeolus papilionaceus]|nr:hypothetical protein BJ165DRAFT_1526389 [Panaeolus papilionaceus]
MSSSDGGHSDSENTLALTSTRARRAALIHILERVGVSDYNGQYGKLADELIAKFKWVARSVSHFIDVVRVIIANVERDEDLSTLLEKKQYEKIVALHPALPQIFLYASTRLDIADTLSKIIEFHVNEAKNSDTNTLRYLIPAILPLDSRRDVVHPPITGTGKDDRGFNHPVTAAALTPLKLRHEFDEDKRAFQDKVNGGEIKITHKLFPSVMYPDGTIYDRGFIEDDLFRGHVFIRAMRAIYHGKSSALSGVRTGSKSSQAEMHGMECPIPEAVGYTGVHLVFALDNIDNWARLHNSSFDYVSFYRRIVTMFTDPEDDWSRDTLDFLQQQMPVLRQKQCKRKRYSRDSSPGEEGNESDDELRLSLKRRQTVRQRQEQSSRHEVAPPALPPHHSLTLNSSPRHPQATQSISSSTVPVTPLSNITNQPNGQSSTQASQAPASNNQAS